MRQERKLRACLHRNISTHSVPLRYALFRPIAMHVCSLHCRAHSSSACTAAGAAAGSGSAAAGDAAASGGANGWSGGSHGSDSGSKGTASPQETDLGGDEWEEPAEDGGSALMGELAGVFGLGGDD